MKTLFNLLLVFSLILSTSCSKENSLVPDVKPEQTGITANDLVGNWNFVSLEYQGRTIYGYDAELKKTKDFVTLGLREVTASTLRFYCDCSIYLNQGETKLSDFTYNYTLSKTELNADNVIKFEIISASKTTLKLKMTYGNTNMPIGGTYTLKKAI